MCGTRSPQGEGGLDCKPCPRVFDRRGPLPLFNSLVNYDAGQDLSHGTIWRIFPDTTGAPVRRHARPCRARRGGRRGCPAGPPRRSPCRGARRAGPGHRRADAARHHLPHRLDDQAGHRRGGHDPGRGGEAPAGRSGRPAAAGTGRPACAALDRRSARRHGAGQPPDHAARPADLPPGLRRGDGAARALPDPGGDRARPASPRARTRCRSVPTNSSGGSAACR